ncbi:hypothetical protein BHM03_00035235 [Ensete ventricosum]|nr:hypothetical protein BHM03_00035235 [Ensete ventricosum]
MREGGQYPVTECKADSHVFPSLPYLSSKAFMHFPFDSHPFVAGHTVSGSPPLLPSHTISTGNEANTFRQSLHGR